MRMLQFPWLNDIAARVEQGACKVRWVDLYAAQHLVDLFDKASVASDKNVSIDDKHAIASFTLALSYCSSQGLIRLDLGSLDQLKLSGFKLPEYSSEQWMDLLNGSNIVQTVQSHAELTQDREPLQTAFCFDDEAVITETILTETNEAESAPSRMGVNLIDHRKPLVLDGEQVYLARFWNLYTDVENWFNARLILDPEMTKEQSQQLQASLADKFGLTALNDDIDWQACAAAQALSQRLCLISGGPGTGKTTTAANILALLIERHEMLDELAPKIRLLAPTGKAAIRLYQSIRDRFQDMGLSEYLTRAGETIHRFLNHVSHHVRQDPDVYLLGGAANVTADVDILLVDEASMIDLNLMANLVKVIPESTRVIMLGDHHQLPAVEPGQVFSEWLARYQNQPYGDQQLARIRNFLGNDSLVLPVASAAHNPVCQLLKTYRFGGQLKQVAELMKQGSEDDLVAQLKTLKDEVNASSVAWNAPQEDLYQKLSADYRAYFDLVQQGADFTELSKRFSQFQVLCSTHEGPLGAKSLNEVIERFYVREINQRAFVEGVYYHGKAIMVTENHAKLGIFNGDIGFFIRKPSGHYVVAFAVSDIETGESFIEVAPASIRAWQPAYAITVHKSQGSEYEHVSLVVADYAKELLSRSLLYTGLTRGKNKVDIWASEESIRLALS